MLFLPGCNFECPYCHNPGLVKGGGQNLHPFGEEEMTRFLKSRRGFLDGVVISGGEPTLQEGLVALCRRIKGLGYPIKLDTNGSKPSVLAELLKEDLLGYVAVDIKTDPMQYDRFVSKGFDADNLLSSIRMVVESGVDHEFRTTCVPPIVDETVVENIAKTIKGANLYVLQHFHRARVLKPHFFFHHRGIYSEEDLGRFKGIASRWVDCIVR